MGLNTNKKDDFGNFRMIFPDSLYIEGDSISAPFSEHRYRSEIFIGGSRKKDKK